MRFVLGLVLVAKVPPCREGSIGTTSFFLVAMVGAMLWWFDGS
jgi:hypothetical protein